MVSLAEFNPISEVITIMFRKGILDRFLIGILIAVALGAAVVIAANFRHVEARAAPVSLEPGEVGYFLCANSYHTITPAEPGFATIRCNETATSTGSAQAVEGSGRMAPEDDHILLFPGQEKDVACGGGYFEFETYGHDSLGAVCIANRR